MYCLSKALTRSPWWFKNYVKLIIVTENKFLGKVVPDFHNLLQINKSPYTTTCGVLSILISAFQTSGACVRIKSFKCIDIYAFII